MDRRLFIKNTSGAMCLLSLGEHFLSPDNTIIRFGLITDVHFAERQNAGTRYYSQSGRKLKHETNNSIFSKTDALMVKSSV